MAFHLYPKLFFFFAHLVLSLAHHNTQTAQNFIQIVWSLVMMLVFIWLSVHKTQQFFFWFFFFYKLQITPPC